MEAGLDPRAGPRHCRDEPHGGDGERGIAQSRLSPQSCERPEIDPIYICRTEPATPAQPRPTFPLPRWDVDTFGGCGGLSSVPLEQPTSPMKSRNGVGVPCLTHPRGFTPKTAAPGGCDGCPRLCYREGTGGLRASVGFNRVLRTRLPHTSRAVGAQLPHVSVSRSSLPSQSPQAKGSCKMVHVVQKPPHTLSTLFLIL